MASLFTLKRRKTEEALVSKGAAKQYESSSEHSESTSKHTPPDFQTLHIKKLTSHAQLDQHLRTQPQSPELVEVDFTNDPDPIPNSQNYYGYFYRLPDNTVYVKDINDAKVGPLHTVFRDKEQNSAQDGFRLLPYPTPIAIGSRARAGRATGMPSTPSTMFYAPQPKPMSREAFAKAFYATVSTTEESRQYHLPSSADKQTQVHETTITTRTTMKAGG